MAQYYLWGSEDTDMTAVGGAYVSTTSGEYSPLVESGLSVDVPPFGQSLTDYWRTVNQFDSGDVMISVWHWTNGTGDISGASNESTFLLRLVDADGIPRLTINNTVDLGLGPFIIQKVSAAGVYTQLGASFTGILLNTKQKLSIHWTASGLQFYINNALVMGFSGDTTTDSFSRIAGFDLGEPFLPGGTGHSTWSGLVVADFDVRSIDVAKLTLTGAGAVGDFNGTSDGSTINEVVLDNTTGIDAELVDKISLFTAPGTLPTGNWAILGVGVAAYCSAAPYSTIESPTTNADTTSGDVLPFSDTTGIVAGQLVDVVNVPPGTTVLSVVTNTSITMSASVTGDVPIDTTVSVTTPSPQHIEMALRIGSTIYTSGPLDVGAALNRVGYAWNVSPATSTIFTPTELSSLQVGVKSAA